MTAEVNIFYFYTDAVNILADVERAKAKARQIARGENTQVKIGFATSTSTCIKVLERVGRIQENGVHLQTAELSMPELATQLKSRRRSHDWEHDTTLALRQLSSPASGRRDE